MAYRKRHNSDTWHSCRNCSKWPTSDFVTRERKPANPKDLCDQCLAKARDGNCLSGANPFQRAMGQATR